MAIRQDLDLLDSLIRRAASGPPVKHHEVSQALAALERIELALARVPIAGAGGSGGPVSTGGASGGGGGGAGGGLPERRGKGMTLGGM